MTAWEEIERARSLELKNEDGEPVELKLLPPYSEAQLEQLSAAVGKPLPRELVEFLHRCGGVEGFYINFGSPEALPPTTHRWPWAQVFPHCVRIAGLDGDEWILDVNSTTSEVAPVFYAAHEGGVFFHSPSLADFVHRAVADLEHEPEEDLIWKFERNQGALKQEAAAASPDEAVRAFAASLDHRFTIMDLRNAEIGRGFWYGHSNELRRQGEERIFAWAKPERVGLWKRLFSR